MHTFSAGYQNLDMSKPIKAPKMPNHVSGITPPHYINMTSERIAGQSMSVYFHHPHRCPCTSHAHPLYHLPWQGTAPHQARIPLKRGVGQLMSRALQMLLNPAAACWQSTLPCLFLGLLSRDMYGACQGHYPCTV